MTPGPEHPGLRVGGGVLADLVRRLADDRAGGGPDDGLEGLVGRHGPTAPGRPQSGRPRRLGSPGLPDPDPRDQGLLRADTDVHVPEARREEPAVGSHDPEVDEDIGEGPGPSGPRPRPKSTPVGVGRLPS